MNIEKSILENLHNLSLEDKKQVLNLTLKLANTQKYLVKPKGAWRQDPAIGIWENRPEMENSAAWVRQLRQSEWER